MCSIKCFQLADSLFFLNKDEFSCPKQWLHLTNGIMKKKQIFLLPSPEEGRGSLGESVILIYNQQSTDIDNTKLNFLVQRQRFIRWTTLSNKNISWMHIFIYFCYGTSGHCLSGYPQHHLDLCTCSSAWWDGPPWYHFQYSLWHSFSYGSALMINTQCDNSLQALLHRLQSLDSV